MGGSKTEQVTTTGIQEIRINGPTDKSLNAFFRDVAAPIGPNFETDIGDIERISVFGGSAADILDGSQLHDPNVNFGLYGDGGNDAVAG